MSTSDTKLTLARAAMELRAASPARWGEFLAALEVVSTQVRDSFLKEPLERLPIVQGQAQAMNALVNDLRDAPRLVEQARPARSKP